MNPRLDVPVPRHMAGLPRDHRGLIIPWFVPWVDGAPVFPAFDPAKFRKAVQRGNSRCWVCGGKLGSTVVFTIGPMCAINRITTEPPSHLACADYSVRVCPFLANPRMRRVPHAKVPGGVIIPPAGMHDDGNPGVMLLWPTRDYRITRVENGYLLEIGSPTEPLQWWTEGRRATAQEAAAALKAGEAKLMAVARAEGDEAVTELHRHLQVAWDLLPMAMTSAAPPVSGRMRRAANFVPSWRRT